MDDIISVTVGDIYSVAQNTKAHSTTDLSGRTAFGWTGIPVFAKDEFGHIIEFEDLQFIAEAIELKIRRSYS